jgi:hypothetical protein
MVNNDNDCLTCIRIGCGCITALGITAGIIAYFVFGIMYLVQDYNISHDCTGSSLWAYVLTAIILALLRSYTKKTIDEDEDNKTKICSLVCLIFIEMGLAIWGGIELWDKSCDNLVNTNIWKFGLATFYIQIFTASLFLIIILTLFTCFILNNTDNNNRRYIETDNNNNGGDIESDNSYQKS